MKISKIDSLIIKNGHSLQQLFEELEMSAQSQKRSPFFLKNFNANFTPVYKRNNFFFKRT